MYELRRYVTQAGKEPFGRWLSSLRDRTLRARIETRLTRLAYGHFGDCKPLREGVWELRIDAGPGIRVYYGLVGKVCVLLLTGGDKGTQARDIERAVQYWNDYNGN